MNASYVHRPRIAHSPADRSSDNRLGLRGQAHPGACQRAGYRDPGVSQERFWISREGRVEPGRRAQGGRAQAPRGSETERVNAPMMVSQAFIWHEMVQVTSILAVVMSLYGWHAVLEAWFD